MGVSVEVLGVNITVTPLALSACNKQVVEVPYWATHLVFNYGYLRRISVILDDVSQTVTLSRAAGDCSENLTVPVGRFIDKFAALMDLLGKETEDVR